VIPHTRSVHSQHAARSREPLGITTVVAMSPRTPDGGGSSCPTTTRIIDADFITQLGKDIQAAADRTLPEASRLAADAQNAMMGAGQAGGLLAVVGFLVASEYAEHAWATKQATAAELNTGLARIAQNWRDVEQANQVC
jgi:hypothetical protein